MKKEMLINVLQPEEIRIAIVEDGVLEELYVERTSHESYVGNIYKGRIVNIEPSIQAAFVDFGVGRNGFLHVSDVEPAYYRHLEQAPPRDRRGGGRRGPRPQYPEDTEIAPPRRSSREEEFEDEFLEAPAEPVLGPYGDEPPTGSEEGGLATDDYEETEGYQEVEEETGLTLAPGEGRSLDPTPLADETEQTQENALVEDAAPSGEPTPEEGAEDAPKRRGRRRGGRGRGRRGKGDKTAGTPEEGAEGVAGSETNPPENADPTREPSDDRPRFMDATERRTAAGDEPIGPLSGGPADISDDDLSFSRRPAREPAHQEPAQRAPLHHEPESAPHREEWHAPAEEFAGYAPAEPMEEMRESPPPYEYQEAPAEHEPAFPPGQGDDEDMPPQRGRGGDRDRGDRDRGGDRERGGDRGRGRDRGPDRGRDRDRGRGRDGGRERERGRERGRDAGRDGGRDRGRRPGGNGGRPGLTRPKPLIQDIFKRGQEVLVQVIKEGIGTKGPTLSTYISIAGRYLVLMPGLNRIGVSRKIEDDETRRRLRDIMRELQPPPGLGFIIRTAGSDRNKKELQGDLGYLARLWKVVARRIKKVKGPAEIYQESDMITRTIRDIFTNEIDTIYVDEPAAYEHAKEFLEVVMPRYASRIKLWDSPEPMFHKYGIEQEITRIQQKKVPLPYGGSIVIEQTEALVAIDVNSGNFRADNNAEETAYQMNLQAAKEIARQLRLRDLGGVIVNDFIDMRDEKHRRNVERALREAVERDRARTKILRISQFGIIEMTRQRIRPSLKRSVYHDCPHCHGHGQVKTCESMSIEAMRLLQLAAHRELVDRIEVKVQDEVAFYLVNRKRKELAKLEENGKQVLVRGVTGAAPEFLEMTCFDNNGHEVKFLPYEEPAPQRPQRRMRHH